MKPASDAPMPSQRGQFLLLCRIGLAHLPMRPLGHAAIALTALLALVLLLSWPPSPTQARAPLPRELPAAAMSISPATAAPMFAPPLVATLPLSEAEKLNAAMPIARAPNPSAQRFLVAAGSTDAQRSLECLTAAIYFEATSEGEMGQRAVAQVVLNRVRHPAFPKSVCGVVFQGAQRAGGTGCQFTFTCDGALARTRSLRGWAEARLIAAQALAGHVEPSVGLATHYHTVAVVPFWRDSLTKVANIGAHIFYRWSGAAGLPAAFTGRYAGESQPMAALVARPVLPDAAVTTPIVDLPVTAVATASGTPVTRAADRAPSLAVDLSGMAEIEGGPRLILPQQPQASTPAGTAG